SRGLSRGDGDERVGSARLGIVRCVGRKARQAKQMSSGNLVDPRLLAILRCPMSGQEVRSAPEGLVTPDGLHRYRVVSGIPCMIPETAQSTHAGFDKILD